MVSEIISLSTTAPPPGSVIPGCTTIGLDSSQRIGLTFKSVAQCYQINAFTHLGKNSAVDLLVSTAFFGLTLVKFIESIPQTEDGARFGWAVLRDTREMAPLMFLFFRDASVYYFAILGEHSAESKCSLLIHVAFGQPHKYSLWCS